MFQLKALTSQISIGTKDVPIWMKQCVPVSDIAETAVKRELQSAIPSSTENFGEHMHGSKKNSVESRTLPLSSTSLHYFDVVWHAPTRV